MDPVTAIVQALGLAVALVLLALAFLAVRALWRAVGRTVGSIFRRPVPR